MELSLDLPNDVRGWGKRRSGGNVSVGRSASRSFLTHSPPVCVSLELGLVAPGSDVRNGCQARSNSVAGLGTMAVKGA